MSEEHTCSNCGMAFEKAEHLSKHQLKFCVGSGYADVQSLEAKYNEQFRNAGHVSLPSKKVLPRRADLDDDAYQLELDKERIRQGGLAQRQYNKLLDQIRFEEEKKYNAKAEKERIQKELRQLQGMEAGELAFQKQQELDQLTRKKRTLEMEEDSLKNELNQFLGKKKQLEQEAEIQNQQIKMKGSQARNQLEQVKNLEDDFAINQGRKMAELQLRRQNLQQQRKNIESNLQQIRDKKGNPDTFSPSSYPTKLPVNAYTFKPQPFDKVESYRKLGLMNDTGDNAQEKLHMINSQIAKRTGTPNTQLIEKRRRQLDDLRKEYQSNGGDDPQFYSKIKNLEKKYEIAESKVGMRQQKPMDIEHRPYQPPKLGQSQASETGPQPMNPFYNPNSPFEMYDKFAVKPGQAPSQPEYVLAPNTFGNNQRLLLQERIAPDQSIEERVLSSVMAQQYDSLQILSRLPKDSQIYKLKLKQYEQLIKIRQDLVKQAHLQRLKRVKRQFQMEKKLAEKDINNDQFVDGVRRRIIDGRLENPPAMSNRLQFFVNVQLASGLPVEAAKAKVNMTIFKDGQKVTQAKQTKQIECEKKDNSQICRIHEKVSCALEPRANLNAVFEVLLSHRDSPDSFKVYSYGTLKLTNQQMRIGAANYELSMFDPPYRPLSPSENRQTMPNHNLYLKIYVGDEPLNQQYVNPKGISHKTQYDIFNSKKASPFEGTGKSFRPHTQGSQLNMVPSTQRLAAPSNPKGFQFRNIIVRTEKPQQTLWVEFTVYQEDIIMRNNRGAELQHKTSYIQTVDMGKRVNNLASARVQQSYRIYEDLERHYKKNQRQLFLLITLMQKQGNQSEPKGWHCLRLTNFQEMREGIVKVNLFAPKLQYPPVDMNRVQGKMRDQIEFQIVDFVPTVQEIEPKPKTAAKKKTNKLPVDKSNKALHSQRSREKMPQVQPATNRSSKQSVFQKLSQALSRKTMSYQSLSNPNESQTSLMNDNRKGRSEKATGNNYIPNNAMGIQNTPKSQCSTFQVHISKLRFVPGSIGIARVNIVLVGRKGAVMDTPTASPVIYNDNYDINDQTIDFGKVFKGGDKFPHDAMIMMEVQTYHEESGEAGYLGCSIMPVFVDIKGQQFLSEGHYQLPIFWALHTTQFDIDVAFSMPKVPCVSLLVSIGKKVDTKNIPDYSSGKFCTVFFNIDNMEQRLLNVMSNQSRHTYAQSLSKYFKTQGITRKYTNKEIEFFFQKSIKYEKVLLNLNHLIPYDSSFGFSLNIDGLINVSGNNLFLVTICVSPPAFYYHKEKMDLVFLTAVDPNSHRKFPQYDNNTFSFNEKYDPNLCFIIEIAEIHLINIQNFEVSLVSYGHCILPAFQVDGPFVNAGEFTMPVCDGDYPEEKVPGLDNFAQNRTQLMLGDAKLTETKLKLRMVNNYFPEQYLAPAPEALVEQGTGKRPKSIKEQDQVVSILPKNIQPGKFFELLDECIFRLYEDDDGD